MQDQFFKDFFEKARLEKEKFDAEKKRKKHFQEIGRKGEPPWYRNNEN